MENKKTRIGYAIALTRHIKGFKLYLIVSVFCSLIFKALPLLTGLATSYMVSTLLLGDTSLLIKLFAAIMILIVSTAVFSYLDVLVSHDMAYRILTKLRENAYDKIDILAPAVMESKQSGDLISVVLNDVETLEWFFAHTIVQLIIAVTIPVLTLIFMGSFSWILPAVILPFIVLLVLIPKISGKKADAQGSKVRMRMGKLNAEIIDGIQGLKDIISFRWQRDYFRRFFKTNHEFNAASVAYTKRSANEKRRISLITEIAWLSAEIATVFLIITGKLDMVWLMPMFVLSSAIFSPIQEALAMSTNYGLIFGAAKRLFDLFQMKPKVLDQGTHTINDITKSGISHIKVSFQDVKFTYPTEKPAIKNKPVLKGLSFCFKTGETVALVGVSGGGKTTVARLLQRFWDIDSGSIEINGIDIRNYRLNSLREIVTVVPQDVYLFNMSVRDNLSLANAGASLEEIEQAAKAAQADAFIKNLPYGYDTVIGERGLRLSGGEKQRLSIAQALLKDSPVLVLDEASANLDSENERLINLGINKLKNGRATLVIAHRISTIQQADRIVVLKDGCVAADGKYTKLLKTCPYFRKLIGDEYEE